MLTYIIIQSIVLLLAVIVDHVILTRILEQKCKKLDEAIEWNQEQLRKHEERIRILGVTAIQQKDEVKTIHKTLRSAR